MTQSVPVTLKLTSALDGKTLIADEETFKKIGDWSNQKKEFLLLNDLTLNNWEGPSILGPSGDQTFFDGGGHTVTINSFAATGAGYYGLFRDASDAAITGLNIDLNITTGPADTRFIGGLTPIGSKIEVTDVHVSGDLNVATISYSGDSYAGGIVGELSGGSIISCSSKLNLTLETNSTFISTVGGIAGQITDAGIADSFFGLAGIVKGKTAGGIVGEVSGSGNSWVKHCYSAGTVQGPDSTTDPVNAGGIAGTVDGSSGSTIDVSYFSGQVIIPAAGGGAVGGIAGTLTSTSGIGACLVLEPTLSVPSGLSWLHRIVGNSSGTLANNSAYNGTLTQDGNPVTIPSPATGSNFEGADLPSPLSDPPIASDFPSSLEVDYSTEFGFVMSPWGGGGGGELALSQPRVWVANW
jgi:hypothetical protein